MSDASPPQSGAPIYRVVCGWCPTVLVEGDPGAPVSHGLCNPCDEKVRRELDLLEKAAA